jgi:hypothetical protein
LNPLVGKPEVKNPLVGKPERLNPLVGKPEWINLGKETDKWRAVVNMVMNIPVQ